MKKSLKAAMAAATVLAVAFILILVVAVWGMFSPLTRRELCSNPVPGVWYRISPQDAVDSTGDAWHGYFRLGTENKVLIDFMGGGFSVDTASASMGEDFYYRHSNHDEYIEPGIADTSRRNPFRNWTVIVITYSTGDFHLGTGELQYQETSGQTAVMHYHGYLNYKAMMEASMAYVGTPDEVLIAGWSAGGFGAAVLADRILDDYFQNTEKSTVLVDSAILCADWMKITQEVWHTPAELSGKLSQGNLTLESLQCLSEHHPDTTILYCGSARDAYLTKYQNYLLHGYFSQNEETKSLYQQKLHETVEGILKLPHSGVFIWDDHPDSPDSSTGHISLCKRFYKTRFNGTTIAGWVQNAVDGEIQSYGLEFVEKNEFDAEEATDNEQR